LPVPRTRTGDGKTSEERQMDGMRKLVSALVVLAAGIVWATHGHAAAPIVGKGQAPGWYRMMLGDFEVVALSDGTLGLEVKKLLTNTTPARVDELLHRSFLADPIETSVNGYLVNTGAKLVLIDTGAGGAFGPTLGVLVQNLKAAGYQPEQVDEIYITHMHGDHIGGLVAGDALVFPNAVVRADQRDAAFWLSPAVMDSAPKDAKDSFAFAMKTFAALNAAGKFKPFDGATELVPGIRALPTYGHTKGHTAYAVESKGQKMVMIGDMMHVGSVQFAVPSVTIQFDTDSKSAAAQRKKMYAQLAKERAWLAVAHLPFPGIGHIRGEGTGYVYVPANYSVPR
jgi:glyoxylase-like metal-dependent hydrolase (beta-lactamase superfamily II)